MTTKYFNYFSLGQLLKIRIELKSWKSTLCQHRQKQIMQNKVKHCKNPEPK